MAYDTDVGPNCCQNDGDHYDSSRDERSKEFLSLLKKTPEWYEAHINIPRKRHEFIFDKQSALAVAYKYNRTNYLILITAITLTQNIARFD